MKTKIGTYVGTGSRFSLNLGEGVAPKAIFIKGESSGFSAQWIDTNWTGRGCSLGSHESAYDVLRSYSDGVLVGTDATVNSSGVRYYWIALFDDGAGDFETQGYMGNATAGRVVDLRTQKPVAAVLIKRDSVLPGIVQVGAKKTAYLDDSYQADCVALGVGQFTTTAASYVNEYTSAGNGEGITALALFDGSNDYEVVSWSGTPAAGTVVPTKGDPVAALIFSTGGQNLDGRILTRDMPVEQNSACYASNTAMADNEAALVPGGIRLGSSAALRTAAEISAIVFFRKESVSRRAPTAIIKGRKGVFLGGRGVASNIQCGNSDATLKIDGAISIEWFGVPMTSPGTSPTTDATLLTRGVGPAATPGAYSWGLGLQHKNDFGWSGGQVYGVVSGQYNFAEPLDSCVWRTGDVPEYNAPVHYVMTHAGNGKWRLYRNGQLIRQRDQNIPPNVTSGAGHFTAFGGRPNSGSYTSHQRMIVMAGRVYSRALSADDVTARYEREALGSATADITSGLAESWDFSAASGVIVPAVVSASNNGTISNGRIITL